MKIEDIEKIFVDLIYQPLETQRFVGACFEDIRLKFCNICGEKVLSPLVIRNKKIYHEICFINGNKGIIKKTKLKPLDNNQHRPTKW